VEILNVRKVLERIRRKLLPTQPGRLQYHFRQEHFIRIQIFEADFRRVILSDIPIHLKSWRKSRLSSIVAQ
jgi:hypothetical protein